jgi:hypothetical protein
VEPGDRCSNKVPVPGAPVHDSGRHHRDEDTRWAIQMLYHVGSRDSSLHRHMAMLRSMNSLVHWSLVEDFDLPRYVIQDEALV